LTEIKFTITLSTFETIDWDNKRENENFVSVALKGFEGSQASPKQSFQRSLYFYSLFTGLCYPNIFLKFDQYRILHVHNGTSVKKPYSTTTFAIMLRVPIINTTD